MAKWTVADLGDQTGKTVIVTGGNSGIGREAAAALAEHGATVVLAVRDQARGEAAAASMKGHVRVRLLDLADLSSIRDFVHGWPDPIDILINNAGIMAVPHRRTVDGFESQFGTNHLGHFALTNLLLPRITDRVVTVSSSAHRAGHIDLADPNWESKPYRAWQAYGQTKLANLLFTLELQRRLAADQSNVRAVAAHPGYAATNLQGKSGNPIGDRLVKFANKVVAQSDAMGALPTLFAATQDIPGASYVGPDGFGEQRGYPSLVSRNAEASDPELAKKLWTLSEQLTQISYPAGS